MVRVHHSHGAIPKSKTPGAQKWLIADALEETAKSLRKTGDHALTVTLGPTMTCDDVLVLCLEALNALENFVPFSLFDDEEEREAIGELIRVMGAFGCLDENPNDSPSSVSRNRHGGMGVGKRRRRLNKGDVEKLKRKLTHRDVVLKAEPNTVAYASSTRQESRPHVDHGIVSEDRDPVVYSTAGPAVTSVPYGYLPYAATQMPARSLLYGDTYPVPHAADPTVRLPPPVESMINPSGFLPLTPAPAVNGGWNFASEDPLGSFSFPFPAQREPGTGPNGSRELPLRCELATSDSHAWTGGEGKNGSRDSWKTLDQMDQELSELRSNTAGMGKEREEGPADDSTCLSSTQEQERGRKDTRKFSGQLESAQREEEAPGVASSPASEATCPAPAIKPSTVSWSFLLTVDANDYQLSTIAFWASDADGNERDAIGEVPVLYDPAQPKSVISLEALGRILRETWEADGLREWRGCEYGTQFLQEHGIVDGSWIDIRCEILAKNNIMYEGDRVFQVVAQRNMPRQFGGIALGASTMPLPGCPGHDEYQGYVDSDMDWGW